MKKLIFENERANRERAEFAKQLVENCNAVLQKFTADFNLFDAEIDEATAFEVVSSPIEYFDSQLIKHSPLKTGTFKPNPVKLAEMLQVDRQGFITACTLLVPGSISQYNRNGQFSVFRLLPQHKHLINWNIGAFEVNNEGLEIELDKNRIYADTDKKLQLVAYWENLAKTMNEHLEKGFISSMDVYQLSKILGLDGNSAKRFEVNYKNLALVIKSM
ncbi:hypothetical protein CYCD_00410 [Tenuifilaceae bacterium CYCD]|nr:hypothetical protein CYCD_00410 [Tenuifilaceae bacterium CYCD]